MSEAEYLKSRFGKALDNAALATLRKYYKERKLALTSPYGRRTSPITGQLEFHNGVDLAPRAEEAWYIPLEGYDEVYLLPYPDTAGGLSVLARFGQLRLGFAHLHSIESQGKRKWRLRIGNTGASTGPHLHFTISYANHEKPELGTPSIWTLDDPAKYLSL